VQARSAVRQCRGSGLFSVAGPTGKEDSSGAGFKITLSPITLSFFAVGGGPAGKEESSAAVFKITLGLITLGLARRGGHNQPIKVVAHLDLAREAGIRPHLESEVEHIFFHRRRFADLLTPGLVDIDVASRAGACAPAFRLNLGNPVIDSRLHDGGTDRAVDGA